MSRISRRTFLEHSLVATAGAAALPAGTAALGQQVVGGRSNGDVIRVAVIGVRGRGRAHVGDFKKSPHAEVVAICDPDHGVIGGAMEAVPDAKYYKDMRTLLEDPSIDAVSIATPNHWHSLATIWALEAGKHVYVEKPISHNVHEGRAVVDVARRTGKLVQHGTQARSHQATREAIAWLHAGGLGRISHAHGLCYKQRGSIGRVEGPRTPPSSLDYDLWTGPARMGPLTRTNLHYDWHWVFNTGNGDIGNQGVHQMDIARWGLGRSELPRRVMSCGGRLGYDDDGETPNSQIALLDYGDQQIIFEVRGLTTQPHMTARIGVIFHGEHGYLVSSSYAKVQAFDHDGTMIKTFTGGGNHIHNFLDAIRSGKATDLTSDALEGHLSAALCHLGNVSHQLGAAQRLSATDTPFRACEPANETFRSLRDHLVSNGIDADDTDYVLGRTLDLDPGTERFVGEGAEVANRLLTRAYREPFSAAELTG